MAFMSPTGGYLVGFLFMPLIYTLVTYIGKKTFVSKVLGLLISLLFLYIFGSVWFYVLYLNNGEAISFVSILLACVVPYIAPDIIKGTLAFLLALYLQKHLPKYFS